MTDNKRSNGPKRDELQRSALDFIISSPEAEFLNFLEEEEGNLRHLSKRGAAAVERALMTVQAEKLAKLRPGSPSDEEDASPRPGSESRLRKQLLEQTIILHRAATDAGLLVSLQDASLDDLTDQQLRQLMDKLQKLLARRSSSS
jgi:hypothetical protein